MMRALPLVVGCLASCSQRTDPDPAVWRPTPGTSWQWQLSGSIDDSLDVAMYDVDLFDAPTAVIERLHARGIKVICYFSAGSFESWRPDAAATARGRPPTRRSTR